MAIWLAEGENRFLDLEFGPIFDIFVVTFFYMDILKCFCGYDPPTSEGFKTVYYMLGCAAWPRRSLLTSVRKSLFGHIPPRAKPILEVGVGR